MSKPRYIVESRGLVGWVVRDREDPFGHEQPRFEGTERECRAVAETLRRKGRRSVEDAVADADVRLLELIEALVGLSRKDPQEVARDVVREMRLGVVCGRCEAVYLGAWPEKCEACETELEEVV